MSKCLSRLYLVALTGRGSLGRIGFPGGNGGKGGGKGGTSRTPGGLIPCTGGGILGGKLSATTKESEKEEQLSPTPQPCCELVTVSGRVGSLTWQRRAKWRGWNR